MQRRIHGRRGAGPLAVLVALSGVGCPEGPDTDSACDDPPCDTDSAEPTWGVLADHVGQGVLLSAWTAGDEVLMVGGDLAGGPGQLARYDGERLCVEASVTERALWWIHGTPDGDWMAVGEAGTVLLDTGGVRSRDDAPTTGTLFGVWIDGEVVWAVGGNVSAGTGEVWRRDSSGWSAVLTGAPGVLFKVWDGWIVGDGLSYELVGDTPTPRDVDTRLLTVRGREHGDAWAVGGTTGAQVRHWTGQAWEASDTTGLFQPLNGVWTAPGEAVWVAGNFGTAAVWDDGTWAFASPPVTLEHLHAAWPFGDEVLFVGGNLFSAGDNYGTIAVYGSPRAPLTAAVCP